ncbi:MAG: serine/threonine-protein kinase, partial [Acidobacteriota bacterium]
MTLLSGSRLGTYEIVDALGAGGMGEVYRARDTRLHREVAIKILPEAFAEDAERLGRFEREARLLAALNHPAIATIHGLEHSGERRFIVMELASGETLADRIAAGALPVPEAIRLGRQIAEGLEAAHARGVIHCDLKPSNIALTPDGRVKLLDFGLARAFATEASSSDLSRSPTITSDLEAPGMISGTVPYMSPEQARGKDVDKRTDIWAFGCVLYEMLTGRRAFSGRTVAETLAAIFETDPDWGLLPAKTPADVRELLRRCCQKDANRRLRDIGDARIELDDSLSGQTRELDARRFSRARLSSRLVLAAAVAAGVALAAAAYFALRPRTAATSSSATRQLAVLPFRNLTGTAEGELMGLAMAETVSVRLANVSNLQVVTPRATIEASDRDTDFARVARRLGANTLLSGTLQRENARFRITYRLVDAGGNQLAANSFDGSELFALQDLVAEGVLRDLSLRRGTRRTPTPSGLETGSEQERYMQAIGLLQRYDKTDSVEQAIQVLAALAAERPNSPLVHAALGRAYLLRFNATRDPKWVDLAIGSCARAGQLAPDLPEVDVTQGEIALRI